MARNYIDDYMISFLVKRIDELNERKKKFTDERCINYINEEEESIKKYLYDKYFLVIDTPEVKVKQQQGLLF